MPSLDLATESKPTRVQSLQPGPCKKLRVARLQRVETTLTAQALAQTSHVQGSSGRRPARLAVTSDGTVAGCQETCLHVFVVFVKTSVDELAVRRRAETLQCIVYFLCIVSAFLVMRRKTTPHCNLEAFFTTSPSRDDVEIVVIMNDLTASHLWVVIVDSKGRGSEPNSQHKSRHTRFGEFRGPRVWTWTWEWREGG